MSQDEVVVNGDTSGEQVSSKLEQAIVEVSIPACYDYLPMLGAVAREFCAALPGIIQEEKLELSATDHSNGKEGRRLGTGTLQLPGSGATIISGYSHFVYSIELLLQEATSNIIRHGYGGKNLEEFIKVKISVEHFDSGKYGLVMELEDSATAFDPTAAPVEMPNPLDPQESGYGIYLIHKLLDKLDYSRHDGKNYLKMVKYLV